MSVLVKNIDCIWNYNWRQTFEAKKLEEQLLLASEKIKATQNKLLGLFSPELPIFIAHILYTTFTRSTQ